MVALGSLALACSSALLVGALAAAPASAAPPRGPKIEAPGGVFVSSTTLGATVEIDGKVVGKVPIDESIVLMPGQHTIKVHLRGYTQYLDTFTVVPGEEVELEVDLIPYAGIVRINTSEPGATIKVDGKVEGVTPFDGDITVGKKQIIVSRPGFHDEIRDLEIMAGEAYNLDIQLRPLPVVVPDDEPAFYETWWFWTLVGVAGAGAATAIVVTSGGEAAPPSPDFVFTIE